MSAVPEPLCPGQSLAGRGLGPLTPKPASPVLSTAQLCWGLRAGARLPGTQPVLSRERKAPTCPCRVAQHSRLQKDPKILTELPSESLPTSKSSEAHRASEHRDTDKWHFCWPLQSRTDQQSATQAGTRYTYTHVQAQPWESLECRGKGGTTGSLGPLDTRGTQGWGLSYGC